MKVRDFRDRLALILGEHSIEWWMVSEIDYPQWVKIKKEIDYLLADAGSEARCKHKQPLYDGIICEICGRKPARDNTLPPPEAV
jgi:hypothetical protein